LNSGSPILKRRVSFILPAWLASYHAWPISLWLYPIHSRRTSAILTIYPLRLLMLSLPIELRHLSLIELRLRTLALRSLSLLHLPTIKLRHLPTLELRALHLRHLLSLYLRALRLLLTHHLRHLPTLKLRALDLRHLLTLRLLPHLRLLPLHLRHLLTLWCLWTGNLRLSASAPVATSATSTFSLTLSGNIADCADCDEKGKGQNI